MNKFTVTIENSLYGSYSYLGNADTLIENEEKSTIQILNLILNYPIFHHLKLNGKDCFNYTPNYTESRDAIIRVIYNLLLTEKCLEISYWNINIWSETTITVKKN